MKPAGDPTARAEYPMRRIGTVRSPYRAAESVPKGLGTKHEAEGVLEIEAEFEAGLQDIEGFSHLYVLWVFHQAQGYELFSVHPIDPQPHGVFSTRSPQRPSPIGLTVVRLLRREGRNLVVLGVDMVDGTPILDIKPYLSSVPPTELKRGWMTEAEKRRG